MANLKTLTDKSDRIQEAQARLREEVASLKASLGFQAKLSGGLAGLLAPLTFLAIWIAKSLF